TGMYSTTIAIATRVSRLPYQRRPFMILFMPTTLHPLTRVRKGVCGLDRVMVSVVDQGTATDVASDTGADAGTAHGSHAVCLDSLEVRVVRLADKVDAPARPHGPFVGGRLVTLPDAGHDARRSEERRVGKECRARRSPYHKQKRTSGHRV